MMMIMEMVMVMVMMTTMKMNNSNFKEKDNLRGLKKTNKTPTMLFKHLLGNKFFPRV